MSERVTLELTFHRDTPGDKGALLLSRGDAKPVWVPKSLVTKIADGKYSVDRRKALECDLLVLSSRAQKELF